MAFSLVNITFSKPDEDSMPLFKKNEKTKTKQEKKTRKKKLDMLKLRDLVAIHNALCSSIK